MKAISSMATRHVLAALNQEVRKSGLPAIDVESLGGVDAANRVAAGEEFDLVFLALPALVKLAESGHVVADTITPLVSSQVAVAVHSDDDLPAVAPGGAAFPDAEHLKQALRDAPRIGYSTGPSGTALVQMVEDWKMSDELNGRLVQARPGIPVARSLAEGDVDLGFQQLSELVGQRGVRILGVMPDDCAIDTVFAGAVASASSRSRRAAEVLTFLASDAVASIKTRHAFGLPTL